MIRLEFDKNIYLLVCLFYAILREKTQKQKGTTYMPKIAKIQEVGQPAQNSEVEKESKNMTPTTLAVLNPKNSETEKEIDTMENLLPEVVSTELWTLLSTEVPILTMTQKFTALIQEVEQSTDLQDLKDLQTASYTLTKACQSRIEALAESNREYKNIQGIIANAVLAFRGTIEQKTIFAGIVASGYPDFKFDLVAIANDPKEFIPVTVIPAKKQRNTDTTDKPTTTLRNGGKKFEVVNLKNSEVYKVASSSDIYRLVNRLYKTEFTALDLKQFGFHIDNVSEAIGHTATYNDLILKRTE